MKFKSILFIAAAALFISHLATAEITALVNYQGKLKKNGQSVNGPVNVTFKVFTGETNSECIYTESQQVTVKEGLYSTLLGKNPSQGNIEDASKLDDAYLEVEINGSTLKPREKFTPPAFAASAPQVWNIFGYGGPSGVTYPASGNPDSIYGDSVYGDLSQLGSATAWDQWLGGMGYERQAGGGSITFPSPIKPVTIKSIKGFLATCAGSTEEVFQKAFNGECVAIDLTPISEGLVHTNVAFVFVPLVQRSIQRSNYWVEPAPPYTLPLQLLWMDSMSSTNSVTNAPNWFTIPLSTNNANLIINPGEYLRIKILVTDTNARQFNIRRSHFMFQVQVR